MAAIYQNAHVFIGANTSPNSHGGFLDQEGDRFRFFHGYPVGVVDGENAVVFARLTTAYNLDVAFQSNHVYVNRRPLSDRAWALQESLLASRMVNFQKPELTWTCDSAWFCECGELDPGYCLRNRYPPTVNSLLSTPG